jgi:hypothetical protein
MDPNAGLSEQEAQMVKYVRALSFARGEAAPLFVLEEQWKENLGRSNGHLRTFC